MVRVQAGGGREARGTGCAQAEGEGRAEEGTHVSALAWALAVPVLVLSYEQLLRWITARDRAQERAEFGRIAP